MGGPTGLSTKVFPSPQSVRATADPKAKKAAPEAGEETSAVDAFQALLAQNAIPQAPAAPVGGEASKLLDPRQAPADPKDSKPAIQKEAAPAVSVSSLAVPAQQKTDSIPLPARAPSPNPLAENGAPFPMGAQAPQIPISAAQSMQQQSPAKSTRAGMPPALPAGAASANWNSGFAPELPPTVPSWLSNLGTDLTHAPSRQKSSPIDLNELSAFEAAEDPFAGEAAMPGSAQFLSSNGTPTAPMGPGRNAPNPGASAWSGADYLSMMGAARAPLSLASQNGPDSGGNQGFGPRPEMGAESFQGASALQKKKFPHESALVFNPNTAAIGSGPDQQAPIRFSPAAVPMRGDVIPGANAESRLAKVSVLGLSTGIRDFARSGGRGEMRLRLNPEHLGELRLQVNSEGREVALRIQAADERSKKILESSLSDLRDGLSIHNLNLGRVEVSVAPPAGSALSAEAFGWNGASAGDLGSSSQGQNAWNDRAAMADSRSNRGDSSTGRSAPSWNAPSFASNPRSSYAPGRLDVVA